MESISSTDFFNRAQPNSLIPDGSLFSTDAVNNAMQVALPKGHCTECSDGAVIINGTERADYQIDGELNYKT